VKSNVELIQSIDLASLPTPTPGVSFANLGFAKGTEIGQVDINTGGHTFTGAIGIMVTMARRCAKSCELRGLTITVFLL
jgi:hypothetical protein